MDSAPLSSSTQGRYDAGARLCSIFVSNLSGRLRVDKCFLSSTSPKEDRYQSFLCRSCPRSAMHSARNCFHSFQRWKIDNQKIQRVLVDRSFQWPLTIASMFPLLSGCVLGRSCCRVPPILSPRASVESPLFGINCSANHQRDKVAAVRRVRWVAVPGYELLLLRS